MIIGDYFYNDWNQTIRIGFYQTSLHYPIAHPTDQHMKESFRRPDHWTRYLTSHLPLSSWLHLTLLAFNNLTTSRHSPSRPCSQFLLLPSLLPNCYWTQLLPLLLLAPSLLPQLVLVLSLSPHIHVFGCSHEFGKWLRSEPSNLSPGSCAAHRCPSRTNASHQEEHGKSVNPTRLTTVFDRVASFEPAPLPLHRIQTGYGVFWQSTTSRPWSHSLTLKYP